MIVAKVKNAVSLLRITLFALAAFSLAGCAHCATITET
jgi:hypothetical protein